MLKIVNGSKTLSPLTLDSLYAHAKEMGLAVKIDDDTLFHHIVEVELKYKNKSGSTFWFKGKSTNSINEAFLNAFKEAEVIGKGYGC